MRKKIPLVKLPDDEKHRRILGTDRPVSISYMMRVIFDYWDYVTLPSLSYIYDRVSKSKKKKFWKEYVTNIPLDKMRNVGSLKFMKLEIYQDLIKSIKKEGVKKPIFAFDGRKDFGGYFTLDGSHRAGACSILGMNTIPAFIIKMVGYVIINFEDNEFRGMQNFEVELSRRNRKMELDKDITYVSTLANPKEGTRYISQMLWSVQKLAPMWEQDRNLVVQGTIRSYNNGEEERAKIAWNKKKIQISKKIEEDYPDCYAYFDIGFTFLMLYYKLAVKDFRNMKVVQLYREPAKIAKTLTRVGFYSNEYVVAIHKKKFPHEDLPEKIKNEKRTGILLVPEDSENLTIFTGSESSTLDKCIWYIFEMNARKEKFRKNNPKIPVFEFDLDNDRNLGSFEKLIKFLDPRLEVTDELLNLLDEDRIINSWEAQDTIFPISIEDAREAVKRYKVEYKDKEAPKKKTKAVKAIKTKAVKPVKTNTTKILELDIEPNLKAPIGSGFYYGVLYTWFEYIGLSGTGLCVGDKEACKDFLKSKYPKIEKIYTVNLGGKCDYVWDITYPFPIDDAPKFDFIICQAVLEHVVDPTCAVGNLLQLLKPGGELLVHTHGPGFPFHRKPLDCFRFYEDSFIGWAKRFNVELEDLFWTARDCCGLYRAKGEDDPPKKVNFRVRHKQEELANVSDQKPLGDTPLIADKINKDICVAIFTYPGHMSVMRPCIESIRKLDLYTILSYDNVSASKEVYEKPKVSLEKFFPDLGIMNLVDSIVMKHRTPKGVDFTWIWHCRYSLPIIEDLGFKYVFLIGGDCYLEKPENFSKLRKAMKGYDIMTYWYDHYDSIVKKGNGRIGTMAWICKVSAFRKIIDSVANNWYHVPPGGKAEERVAFHAYRHGFTLAPTVPYDFDFRMKPEEKNGLFHETIGLRHLQFEHAWRKQEGMDPLPDNLINLNARR